MTDSALIATVSAGAALLGAIVGGAVSLFGQRSEMKERRRWRLVEAYGDWIAASDLLSQTETKAFNLALQGLLPEPKHALHERLGQQMKETVDEMLRTENLEESTRARLLLMEWRQGSTDLAFKAAEIKPLNDIKREAQEKGVSLWELRDRFYELTKRQAAIRTLAAEDVYKRIASKLKP